MGAINRKLGPGDWFIKTTEKKISLKNESFESFDLSDNASDSVDPVVYHLRIPNFGRYYFSHDFPDKTTITQLTGISTPYIKIRKI